MLIFIDGIVAFINNGPKEGHHGIWVSLAEHIDYF